MPDYSLMNIVPKFTPPIFIYFNVMGRYLGMGDEAISAAVDGGVGDVFGELLYGFMTNSKISIMGLVKCGLSYAVGAFVGVRFILPMTGITPSKMVVTLAAVIGGHVIKWLSNIFLNK